MNNNPEISNIMLFDINIITDPNTLKSIKHNVIESQAYDISKNNDATDFIIYPANPYTNEPSELYRMIQFAKDMNCNVIRIMYGGPTPGYFTDASVKTNPETPLTQKMATVSTGTINQGSRDRLSDLASDITCFDVMNKAGWGWFVNNSIIFKNYNIPDDIRYQLTQSFMHNCSMTCFDSDAVVKF